MCKFTGAIISRNIFYVFMGVQALACTGQQEETPLQVDSVNEDALTISTSSYLHPSDNIKLCVTPTASSSLGPETTLRVTACSEASTPTFTYINHNISTTSDTCVAASTLDGHITLISCAEKDPTQQWSLKNGTIILKNTSSCLSTTAAADGDPVTLSPCKSANAKMGWSFETVAETGGTTIGGNATGEANSAGLSTGANNPVVSTTAGSTVPVTTGLASTPGGSGSNGGAETGTTGNAGLLSVSGYASVGAKALGGARADAAHTYNVRNRAELIAALDNSSATPKVLYVTGTIEGNVDDNDRLLSEADYAQGGYSQSAYVAAYDPGKWGTSKVPSGSQEDARSASQKAQAARVLVKVGSNTSILGLGSSAIMHGLNLYIPAGVSSVVIRNMAFTDAYDYFPAWDPTDGSDGNWNSAYDNITIKGASLIWIDHCEFSDGVRTDNQTTSYYGRQYQHHDGLVDITDAADLVTVSYSYFHDHDKGMLIGSSDSKTSDSGKLRTTLHHNVFERLTQRQPRVRFGQVHVYNNLYSGSTSDKVYATSYALGIGISSHIYSEANAFDISGAQPSDVISVFKGALFFDTGSIFNGGAVDLNATAKTSIGAKYSSSVGWNPGSSYVYTIDDAQKIRTDAAARAGVGKIAP
ncbi:MAG: hypothetical protein EOO38_00375 [Cytophagaceae bacterium]|nr:MAG: hypothetical protein EOO38_00375 [Cytophagaceae bacterium]